MPTPVVPYDPPPRPSSRSSRSAAPPPRQQQQPQQSLFDRVKEGLQTVEHFADEAQYVAGQVGKAARVGEKIERDVEDAYGPGAGAGGRSGSAGYSTEGGSSEDEGGEQPQAAKPLVKPTSPSVVPYESARSSTTPAKKQDSDGARQRKQNSSPSSAPAAGDEDLDAFEHDLDLTQESIDHLSDSAELIAVLRHRLTGGLYPRIAKLLRKASPAPLSRSREVEADEAGHLAALVGEVKDGLLEQYKAVCALQPRYQALSSSLRASSPSSSSAAKTLARLQRHFTALNSSFASLLDFVEDRGKDERKDRDGGESEARLMARMKEDEPTWRREKRVREAKKAREVARGTSLGKVDLSTYAGFWLRDNPFTELDSVLQTIDLAENGIGSKQDEKKGTWALGSLLSRVMHPSTSPSRRSRRFKSSSGSKVSYAEHELTKRRSARSSTYHSEEKPALPLDVGSDVSTDTDEWSDAEKKLLQKKGAAGGIDLSKLPERVPTDDTSGYQETPEELLEDARDQSRTEHIYTPLLVAWWAAIACLYLYWGIARAIGFENPLGNVDLGSHLGNERWNDTKTLSSASASPSTSTLPSPSDSPVHTSAPSSLFSVSASYSALVAFGASYTDNAHSRSSANADSLRDYYPYDKYDGRYGNGPVAVEYMVQSDISPALNAESGSVKLIDYAYGGSVIQNGLSGTSASWPAAKDQIATYLTDLDGGSAAVGDGRVLHYFNSGINPVSQIWNNALGQEMSSSAVAKAKAALTANTDSLGASIRSIIDDSNVASKSDYLLAGIPQMDLVPTFGYQIPSSWSASQRSQALAFLKTLSDQFNGEVEALAAALKKEVPNSSKVFFFDMAALWTSMHTSPKTYGITASPTTKTCYDSSTGSVCSSPQNYLYFDTLHPVTSVHELMAQKMNAVVLGTASANTTASEDTG
ncbi:hypothetical protein JCM10213_006606 [Rhodosporidiobolus nylandii]